MDEAFAPGDRVRVKRDCPLTLPAYAQVMHGIVVALGEDDDTVEVEFAENRTYPVPAKWIERVDDE